MFRKLSTSLIAASLVLTSFTTTPAIADERNTARVIATILGIAMVGKIIKDSRDDKRKVSLRPPEDPFADPKPDHPLKPRPLPRRADTKLLPSYCLQSYDGLDGVVNMFDRDCLEQNYRFVDYMPLHCEQVVDTFDGFREGFEARCLRHTGYRLAHN